MALMVNLIILEQNMSNNKIDGNNVCIMVKLHELFAEFIERYLNIKGLIGYRMTTVTVNQKVLNLLDKMSHRLQKIELEVKEIKGEMGLEVRPEYAKKLKRIEKDTISFDNKEDFLDYLENEI